MWPEVYEFCTHPATAQDTCRCWHEIFRRTDHRRCAVQLEPADPLVGVAAFFCTDFSAPDLSAHRLGEVDYAVAAFTHGPEITDRARDRVRDFLAAPHPGARHDRSLIRRATVADEDHGGEDHAGGRGDWG